MAAQKSLSKNLNKCWFEFEVGGIVQEQAHKLKQIAFQNYYKLIWN
jgi:hypothetical protein